MAKTNLDLHQSASAAAFGTLDLANRHTISLEAHKIFACDKQDPRDYDYWETIFWQQRQFYLALRGQKPTSVAQDEQEAVNAEQERKRKEAEKAKKAAQGQQ